MHVLCKQFCRQFCSQMTAVLAKVAAYLGKWRLFLAVLLLMRLAKDSNDIRIPTLCATQTQSVKVADLLTARFKSQGVLDGVYQPWLLLLDHQLSNICSRSLRTYFPLLMTYRIDINENMSILSNNLRRVIHAIPTKYRMRTPEQQHAAPVSLYNPLFVYCEHPVHFLYTLILHRLGGMQVSFRGDLT